MEIGLVAITFAILTINFNMNRLNDKLQIIAEILLANLDDDEEDEEEIN